MPKKQRKDWGAIKQKIKDRKKKYNTDERVYKVVFNEKKASKVTLRFLDAPDIDMPYAEHITHFFNDQGGWFVADCPTLIHGTGQGICPVCDDLYAGNYYDEDRETYFDRKKKTSYYTNVLIIKDDNTPSNEGKVFLFKFGTKIMEKIDDIIEEDKMPWDEENGVNFIFSAKKGANNMTNYDASRFSDAETSLSEYGDEEEILGQRHTLADFSDEKNFKSYEDLKEKYEKVTGASGAFGGRKRKPIEEDVEEDEEILEDDLDEDIGDEDMFEEGEDDDGFFDDLEEDED